MLPNENKLLALNAEDKDFIRHHINESVPDLLLKYTRDPHKRRLIEQIGARQRMARKLPEWAKNYDLIFPSGLPLEQASSQQTALLKSRMISGNSMADLTGGLGVDCYYLAQNFKEITYVEQNPVLAEIAAHNFSIISPKIEVIRGSAEKVLPKIEADTIYLDPARRDKNNTKVTELKDYEPNVLALLPLLIQKARKVYLKTSPLLDITLALRQLNNCIEVWVISHKNDCKEVIYLLDFTQKEAPLSIKTFNITLNNIQIFSFNSARLNYTKPDYSFPLAYLYEPNVSVMKSGGMDILARDCEIFKLHPFTNIYTSKSLLESFPGRVYKLIQTHKPYNRVLKKSRFNVISRNFPDNALLIAEKLHIKPDNKKYLLAVKTVDNSYQFLDCELLKH